MSSPKDKTIDRKAEKLGKELFKHGQYYYHKKDIIRLLNKLSEYDQENEHKLLWGDCIGTVIAIKNMIKRLGMRGSNILQVVKQCVVGCMLDIKEEKYDMIHNKELIRNLLPHKNDECKRDWIQKCVDRRQIYDLFEEPEFFVDIAQSERASS